MAKKKKRIPAETPKLGTPVAKIARPTKPKREFIGRLKGVFKIVGDIESPVDPPEAWEYD